MSGHDDHPPTQAGSFVAWARLITGRADVVVTASLGWLAVAAGLCRACIGDSTFFALLTEPPARLRLRDRLALRLADGVLVDGDATARVVSHPSFPAKSVVRIVPRYPVPEIERRAQVLDGGARRIVVAGNLSPRSGAPDLLAALMTWAEAHPDDALEVAWNGTGDLAGVLAAQPIPPNLSQVFLGDAGPDQAAALYATAWMLVVPGPDENSRCRVAGGFAAGLPVLASRRSAESRLLVTDEVNGWLFDPSKPGDMTDALGRALGVSSETLAVMSARARAALQGPVSGPVLANIRPSTGSRPGGSRSGGSRSGKQGLSLHSIAQRTP